MKINKVMKYEISFDKDLYKILRDVQHAIFRIKNKATSLAWDWQQFSFSYNDRFGVYPKDKNLTGVTLVNDINRNVKHLAEDFSSYTVGTATKQAVEYFKTYKSDIVNGRVSLPTYKRDGSFPIRSQQILGLEKVNTSKYNVNLSLLSREGAKERGCKTQIPVVLKTGKGANVILDRILSGEYKLCDSEITYAKNKFYLNVTYSFEKEEVAVDSDKVMGVDLGIANAAYMAFNDDNYKRYAIEGHETIHFRQKVEARRNAMLKQSKYCGEGRKGHGRKTRMKPIEKLRDKVENFRKTTNHKYSKYIVDMAVKEGAGVIQMEDLSGINERSTFLKQWPYYELQQYVEYKAKEKGVEVRYVKPDYTSQRCSCCGHIAENNRKEQSKFECGVCEYKANADFNAAKNIAEPRIETIISKELERQRLAEREAV